MSNTATPPSFGQRIINLIRFLLRLTLILLLAVGLGGAIYYATTIAIPTVYQQYVQPVEENTQRLADLEARQTQDMETLRKNLETLQERLTAAEILNDVQQQNLTALQDQLGTLEALQSAQSAHADSEIAALQKQLDTLTQSLDALNQGLTTLNQQVATIAEAQSADAASLAEVEFRLQELMLMEHLTRARLFLAQGNLAQAELNARNALEVYSELLPLAPTERLDALTRGKVYLEAALQFLPEDLLQAGDQLEAAWQLLTTGRLAPTATPTPSQTPTPTSTPTPAPSATPEA